MPLEQEIETELRQSIERDPDFLAFLTGEKTIDELANMGTLVATLGRTNVALRGVVLRLAREIDELRTEVQ